MSVEGGIGCEGEGIVEAFVKLDIFDGVVCSEPTASSARLP